MNSLKQTQALERIAQVRYGLEPGVGPEERAEYWSALALEYRRIAGEAMKAQVSPIEVCGTCQTVHQADQHYNHNFVRRPQEETQRANGPLDARLIRAISDELAGHPECPSHSQIELILQAHRRLTPRRLLDYGPAPAGATEAGIVCIHCQGSGRGLVCCGEHVPHTGGELLCCGQPQEG